MLWSIEAGGRVWPGTRGDRDVWAYDRCPRRWIIDSLRHYLPRAFPAKRGRGVRRFAYGAFRARPGIFTPSHVGAPLIACPRRAESVPDPTGSRARLARGRVQVTHHQRRWPRLAGKAAGREGKRNQRRVRPPKRRLRGWLRPREEVDMLRPPFLPGVSISKRNAPADGIASTSLTSTLSPRL